MRTDVTKINEKTPWQGLTEGLQMFAGGTAKFFATGGLPGRQYSREGRKETGF